MLHPPPDPDPVSNLGLWNRIYLAENYEVMSRRENGLPHRPQWLSSYYDCEVLGHRVTSLPANKMCFVLGDICKAFVDIVMLFDSEVYTAIKNGSVGILCMPIQINVIFATGAR